MQNTSSRYCTRICYVQEQWRYKVRY